MFLIVLRLWFRPLLADEDEWAGIELAGRSVLSANDLHEHFTSASYACMSGKPGRETGQSLGCKACDCNLLTDAFALVRAISIPRPLRARGCQKGGRAGLCSSGAGWRHSMSAGDKVACSRQGKHHVDQSNLYLYGDTQGATAVGHICIADVLREYSLSFDRRSIRPWLERCEQP